MDGNPQGPKSYVIGPQGGVLTLDNLPSNHTERWVARKKAEVVMAVRGGLLSLDEACERYKLTTEEFLAWQSALHRSGVNGLLAQNPPDRR